MEQVDPSQESEQKLKSARQRTKIFGVLLIGSIIARVAIKNPAPPPRAIHPPKEVKALPGLLARLPESTKKTLNPQLLAKLQKADQMAPTISQPTESYLVKKSYSIPEKPAINTQDLDAMKDERYLYAMRAHKINPDTLESSEEPLKTIIKLKNGEYIKARRVGKTIRGVEIDIDPSMVARLPTQMVDSLIKNKTGWREPIPRGYVELKPAPGITIQVESHLAKRITVPEEKDDDI